ncbi:MAG: hypothetical protein Q7R87_03185 [Nanoarchaeota archaeon]|nr:hypothetical protein [Nanoarchaeota archaeon]
MKPKAKNLSYFSNRGLPDSYKLEPYAPNKSKEYVFEQPKVDRIDKGYKFVQKTLFNYFPRQFNLYGSSKGYNELRESENNTHYFQSGRSRSYLN